MNGFIGLFIISARVPCLVLKHYGMHYFVSDSLMKMGVSLTSHELGYVVLEIKKIAEIVHAGGNHIYVSTYFQSFGHARLARSRKIVHEVHDFAWHYVMLT